MEASWEINLIQDKVFCVIQSAGLCVTGKTKNRTALVQGSYFVKKEIIQGGEAVCLFA